MASLRSRGVMKAARRMAGWELYTSTVPTPALAPWVPGFPGTTSMAWFPTGLFLPGQQSPGVVAHDGVELLFG